MPPPDAMSRPGEDFDAFFDLKNAADPNDTSLLDVKYTQAPILPISPLSATQNEFNFTYNNPYTAQSLTAPLIHDLPTPSQSSSSPETRSSTDLRLSGETLRDDPVLIAARPLKRKLSPNDNTGIVRQREAPPPVAKKRPHNIIEKRYRANLNEKIAELRDSVPSLRSTKKARGSKDASAGESDDEDLDGLTPSNKLNKASILTKAVEYIRHLEFRTKRLEDENRSLKERLETLDKVIAQGGHDSQRTTAFTSDSVIEGGVVAETSGDDATPEEEETKPSAPVQGLIPIPDSWRRMRENSSQEHYGHVYHTGARRSMLKGKWPTRVMLGSLAGLMVMEGFSESEQASESGQKGLFGIPLELLDGWEFLSSPRIYLSAFAEFCRAGGVLPLVKGFVALTIVAFLMFAYLFNSKPPPKDDVEHEAVCADQAPGPASPIEVRRTAWSTSMQVLRLPHHSFFSEWVAVTTAWLNYTIKYVFGLKVFAGPMEDDAARIKAWDIAIDAQLAGGDTEVSRSRVVLTSFGSGTLPQTPVRMMQKALHCRLLLWNVGAKSSFTFRMWNALGRYVANREWQIARRLQEQASPRDADRLPSNLAALLAMECDEVMTDIVVQRAYNLMYDRPTYEQSEDRLMDVVVEDHGIRSPLDAVSAWRSTIALRRAFETSMQCPGELDILQEDLSLALRIAPPGSAAQVRALAGQALFGAANRGAFHLRAAEIVSTHSSGTHSPTSPGHRGPFFIDSSTPASARPDVDNVLHCAKALIILDGEQDPEKARATFAQQFIQNSTHTTLLTDAAVKHVLARLPVDIEASSISLQAESTTHSCSMSPVMLAQQREDSR
ncbi:Sterol regulatory element-binding protein 1 [Cyphellophora attinorum]|uniref:Sterol regulatory element-binding protein 1 n=1 Tax=Cyphellophora attinorum TaxID=1664694 RepID=A0A0N0NQA3_9EURO|nr:Sterol regulatory element-binding protein 1 [Phialophora attinorum]KPI43469.1 Sterol regulatory element-binding protein 1 [Phialophora attinorum]